MSSFVLPKARAWLILTRLLIVDGKGQMKLLMVVVTLVLTASFPLPAKAQDCRRCSSLPSIEACYQCSLRSPDRKSSYSEAGIRRWCVQNQPACYGGKKK